MLKNVENICYNLIAKLNIKEGSTRMYTIIDVIDKIIEIEKKSIELYELLKNSPNVSEHVKLVAGIFIREEARHIKVYNEIKKEIADKDDILLGFHIYDNISKIIIDFRKGFTYSEANDVKELLKSALNFEEKNLALVIRIQGLLVEKKEDTETNSYKALTKIIHEEKKHIEMIKEFLD